jgi:hypothetical protein
MPIDTVHPAYAQNVERWNRCRAAYEGEDAIKHATVQYLPRLSGQENNDYAAYLMRALYYEAVSRTVDGYVGAIVRKAPVLQLPGRIGDFEQDTTASGIGLVEFIKKLCCENLLAGRMGILVDFDETDDRAYLAAYTSESITNWGDGFVVLKETAYVPTDEFGQKQIEQYRELRLSEGRYVVTIWRRPETASGSPAASWTIHETIEPKKKGIRLKELPFFWLSCFGRSEKIEKPPLLGLVNVALSHYRTSADLEHGRHFTGLPTLWVSGISDSNAQIRVGSQAAILLSDPASKVGYAEFSGQGLGSLERALESKEHMMAVLGAAVFADPKKGVEAAETARIRTSGETSLLTGIVSAVEETLEAALRAAADWMSVSGEIDVAINREFIDTDIDPQLLASLLKSYQSGAISHHTFLFNLQKAERLAPDRSIEDEKKAVIADQARDAPGTDDDQQQPSPRGA